MSGLLSVASLVALMAIARVPAPVAVEGRSPRFELDRERGWDRFRFQNPPVRFRLPRNLSDRTPPVSPGIAARGAPNRVGHEFVVALMIPPELLPSDLERLDRAVAALPSAETRVRAQRANWAESRAAEFDAARRDRARQPVGEAIRIEAEQRENAAPGRQLDLARQARKRQVPEPGPSALIHCDFRAPLAGVKSADEANRLTEQIESDLPPEARSPRKVGLSAWGASCADDPAGTYRMADPAVRAALDRDLLADAILQALKRRAAEAPAQALELADQAAAKLSDRPGIASAPQSGVLDAADVGSLRLAERLGQTDHGRGLLRSWLDYQRASRLSPTDAEGRLTAAQQQYEDLTGDRATAEVLLRKA